MKLMPMLLCIKLTSMMTLGIKLYLQYQTFSWWTLEQLWNQNGSTGSGDARTVPYLVLNEKSDFLWL